MTKFDYIKDKLIHIHSRVTIDSAFKLYDINITAEDMFMHILNDVYGYKLVNANKIKDNFPTVDLIDEKNKLVIQVTSSITTDKINKTLKGIEKFKKDSELKKYADYRLKFLYIVQDKKDLTESFKSKNNLTDDNFLDITDILKDIEGKLDIEVKVFDTLQKIYVDKVETIETTDYIEPRDINVDIKNITILKDDKELGVITLKTVPVEVDGKILNVSIYPITFEEYDLFCDDTNHEKINTYIKDNRDKYPVVKITLDKAKKYCQWLSLKKNNNYRLPTSSEWMSIALQNIPKENFDDYIWHKENSDGEVQAIGTKRAGIKGICDLYGNVEEICSDGVTKGCSYSCNLNNILNIEKSRKIFPNKKIGFRILGDNMFSKIN